MVIKIISALVIIGFFLLLNKIGSVFLEKEGLVAKLFPIGSTILTLFFISLIFFS